MLKIPDLKTVITYVVFIPRGIMPVASADIWEMEETYKTATTKEVLVLHLMLVVCVGMELLQVT